MNASLSAFCQRLTYSFLAIWMASRSADAGPVFYTSLRDFQAVTQTQLVEDFSFSTGLLASNPFTRHGITYTSYSGAFGISVSNDGSSWTVDRAGYVLAVSGNEDFSLTFDVPVHAVGFDTSRNGLGPVSIGLSGASGGLGSYTLDHPGNVVGFLGITSDVAIQTLRWTATGGESINTGMSNIVTGIVTVPEPGSVLMGTTLALGMLMRAIQLQRGRSSLLVD